ncbi:hypothetical protein [Carboxylicivirga marina]|uniref:hypothetical protein n=1 Tax=Carboxylicivirga marina TaxID=2800988 RepID=UPI002592FA46|nr:hypothetical protein [uncultured Carboxylicivirga sp.]
MKSQIIPVVMLFLAFTSSAQSFMPPISGSTLTTRKGMVITLDGDTVKGKFQFIGNLGNIKNVTVKDSSGIKHKLGREQIKKMMIIVEKLDAINTITSSSSIEDFVKTDFMKVAKTDYFIWERAVTIKKGKLKVMQLVNAGFDSKVKVYRDPIPKETGTLTVGGLGLTGGLEKSYYILKAGDDKAIKIEKGKYKKQYYDIFVSDCPKMKDILENKKPDWDSLPAHIFAFDQLCEI